ncbi:MAG: cadherin-like beta sandwich domain-containing protein [Chromatiales bacterium]|nr:cadherin-like beta sandwich domain-containing protein [Chromatiales bacterium]
MIPNRVPYVGFWLLLVTLFVAGCGSSSGGGTPPVAALSGLTLSAGSLSPAFQAATTSYTSVQPFTIESLTVMPTATLAGAQIQVNGAVVASGSASAPIALDVGENTITIAVTAPGATTRSYSVVVTRAPPPVAALSGLALSSGTLVPAFSPSQLEYTTAQGFLVTSLSVTPTEALAGSTIEVDGDVVASGTASAPIALAVGQTQLGIDVSAAAQSAAPSSYEITVTRADLQSFQAAAQTPLDFAPLAPEEAVLFGRAMAIEGDTLVIGVPSDATDPADPQGTLAGSGAVWVYTFDGSAWGEPQQLKASDAGESHDFGWSVALSGDTLVVGAPNVDGPAGVSIGAAYVFQPGPDGWEEVAKLQASNAAPGYLFGTSVAVSVGRIAVGSPQEDSDGTGVNQPVGGGQAILSGAVYLFSDDAGSWTEEAYIKASNTSAGARFGDQVALDGDTLVVGAYGESRDAAGNLSPGSFGNSGAAYIFSRASGDWLEEAYLKAPVVQQGTWFGSAVAVSGDTIAIGSHQPETPTAGPGNVFILRNAAGGWIVDQVVTGVQDDSWTGVSLALDGDVLVVGAPREDGTAAGAGVVRVITRNAGVWGQVTAIQSPDQTAGAGFGTELALSGGRLGIAASGIGSLGTVYLVD